MVLCPWPLQCRVILALACDETAIDDPKCSGMSSFKLAKRACHPAYNWAPLVTPAGPQTDCWVCAHILKCPVKKILWLLYSSQAHCPFMLTAFISVSLCNAVAVSLSPTLLWVSCSISELLSDSCCISELLANDSTWRNIKSLNYSVSKIVFRKKKLFLARGPYFKQLSSVQVK